MDKKVQDLLDTLDRIKQTMAENVDPDGSCRFDLQHMEWMLALTEKTLCDSVQAHQDQ